MGFHSFHIPFQSVGWPHPSRDGRGKWADQFEALDENGTGSAGSQALMGQFRDRINKPLA